MALILYLCMTLGSAVSSATAATVTLCNSDVGARCVCDWPCVANTEDLTCCQQRSERGLELTLVNVSSRSWTFRDDMQRKTRNLLSTFLELLCTRRCIVPSGLNITAVFAKDKFRFTRVAQTIANDVTIRVQLALPLGIGYSYDRKTPGWTLSLLRPLLADGQVLLGGQFWTEALRQQLPEFASVLQAANVTVRALDDESESEGYYLTSFRRIWRQVTVIVVSALAALLAVTCVLSGGKAIRDRARLQQQQTEKRAAIAEVRRQTRTKRETVVANVQTCEINNGYVATETAANGTAIATISGAIGNGNVVSFTRLERVRSSPELSASALQNHANEGANDVDAADSVSHKERDTQSAAGDVTITHEQETAAEVHAAPSGDEEERKVMATSPLPPLIKPQVMTHGVLVSRYSFDTSMLSPSVCLGQKQLRKVRSLEADDLELKLNGDLGQVKDEDRDSGVENLGYDGPPSPTVPHGLV